MRFLHHRRDRIRHRSQLPCHLAVLEPARAGRRETTLRLGGKASARVGNPRGLPCAVSRTGPAVPGAALRLAWHAPRVPPVHPGRGPRHPYPVPRRRGRCAPGTGRGSGLLVPGRFRAGKEPRGVERAGHQGSRATEPPGNDIRHVHRGRPGTPGTDRPGISRPQNPRVRFQAGNAGRCHGSRTGLPSPGALVPNSHDAGSRPGCDRGRRRDRGRPGGPPPGGKGLVGHRAGAPREAVHGSKRQSHGRLFTAPDHPAVPGGAVLPAKLRLPAAPPEGAGP